MVKYSVIVFVKLTDEPAYLTFNGLDDAGKFLNITIESIHNYAKAFKNNKDHLISKKNIGEKENSRIISDIFIKSRFIDGVDYNKAIKIYEQGLRDADLAEEKIKEKLNEYNIKLKNE